MSQSKSATAAHEKLRSQLQNLVFKRGIDQSNNPYSKATFRSLSQCHTAQQGVHMLRCSDSDCGFLHYQYQNCGNRHCPNCGGMRRQQWLEDKTSELLPTAYYHLVFTLPHELNSLTMGNRKSMYDLLLKASSYTILTLTRDEKWLGASPGIISILHTWGQDMSFHPHVHCIVSGGGVVEEKGEAMYWKKEQRTKHDFLIPKAILQDVFKAYYLKQLRKMLAEGALKYPKDAAFSVEKVLETIGYKQWNVYAKKPFGGPKQVLEYLGRYTHKVAITAHRILSIDAERQTITFKYKDYHKRGTKDEAQVMTLSIPEFIRRYEQHFLPKGYVKIRNYGYLRNHKKGERMRALFRLLHLPPAPPKVQIPASQRMLEQHGIDILACPSCKVGRLELLARYQHGVIVAVYDAASKKERVRNKAPSEAEQ